MSTAVSYHFGNYRLAPAERSLIAGDRQVRLGARALDLLIALVERRDRVVGKDELMGLVWPGLVVEENNLQVQVATLRKLLGHPAIATVPGRGYRFTQPVQVEGEAVDRSRQLPPAPIARPELIGREADLSALLALLETERLVTITGAGGIGKTMLARAAAARLAEQGHEICWIDLAPLVDAERVAPTVGRGFGVAVDAAPDAEQVVLELLRDRAALLVLDNAEHLLVAVAGFVDALRRQAPALRMLVTSQERLRVGGEWVYPAAPLSLPAGDDVDAAGASGAVALFVARASAATPGFLLTTANAAAISDICRRLDGIPLAIELAACRIGLLGVEGLRERLNERFAVLTAGARVALRRQQTLRAALEWSHALLSPAEQVVFRRLGCFVGGFTLEAAQTVAESEDLARWDVLEHLGSLVDKSLVIADGHDMPRYRMLETTRLFAVERLAEAGETAATTERHARAVVEVMAASGRSPRRWQSTPQQFDADAAEVDNARAALDWATTCADHALAIEVAAASGIAFFRADLVNEYLTHVLPMRDRVGADLPADLAAQFWLRIASAGSKSARTEAADAARHAVSLCRQLADPMLLHEALACSVLIAARRVDSAELQAMVDEALALEQPDWPAPARSFLRWAKYRMLRRAGLEEEALQCAVEQGRLSAQRDPVFTLRLTGVNVVDSEIALGHVDAAEARARETLQALREAGIDDSRVGAVHEGLALALILQDRLDEALVVAREAQRRLAADDDDLRVLEALAMLLARRGRADDAARLLGHADAALERQGLTRWPAAAARRAMLVDMLCKALGAERLQSMGAEGAAMSRAKARELPWADARPQGRLG